MQNIPRTAGSPASGCNGEDALVLQVSLAASMVSGQFGCMPRRLTESELDGELLAGQF